MDSKKIGIFIFERRKELGLTQQQLANLLGITNKAVSKWETGEGYPDITLLLVLAKTLKVSTDELLQGKLNREVANSYSNDSKPSSNISGYATNKKFKIRFFISSFWSLALIVGGIYLTNLGMVLDATTEMSQRNFSNGYAAAYILACVLTLSGFSLKIANKISWDKIKADTFAINKWTWTFGNLLTSSFLWVVCGVLLAYFIFMANIRLQDMGYAFHSNNAPMYAVSVIIILGGVAFGILRQLRVFR